jgi:hypothetical protein
MKIRLADWPFDKDEQVFLHWLRSPYQVGEKKQWRMIAVFRKADSSLHEVEVPWGALPMMRLGSAYRGGKPTGDISLGTPARISFSSNARAKILSGLSVPCPYGLKLEDAKEQCVIIWEGGQQIVIPCQEIIRAYFALNRMMADELLRPDSFNGLCVATMTNGEAQLEFSSRVAVAALAPEVVRRIALILFDQNFANSWRRAWASIANHSHKNAAAALQVEPPALAGSEWDVISVNFGQTILVLQITQFAPAISLPFTSISYKHPSFRQYEGERVLGGAGEDVIKQEKTDEASIVPGPESPGKLSRPHTVMIECTAAKFSTEIELTKIQEIVRRDSGDIDMRKGHSTEIIVQRVPMKDCTLNPEGGYGELPSVEFRPFESMEDISPHFRRLFRALNHIHQAVISYVDGKAPLGSSLPRFPKGSGMPRPYVMVCVSTPGERFFLVEVDISDKHSMSTLVFAVQDDQHIKHITEKVLKDGVAGGGHWDRDKLERFHGGRFDLVKHTDSSTESWGQRIWSAGRTARRFL